MRSEPSRTRARRGHGGHRGRYRAARGFTLVEVLVALGLMAIVALLSWRALDVLLRTRETLDARGRSGDAMSLMFAQFDVDCAALTRPWSAAQPLVDLRPDRVALVRDQRDTPDGAGAWQLIVYAVNAGAIERIAYPPVATRAALLRQWQGGERPPAGLRLLDGVRAMAANAVELRAANVPPQLRAIELVIDLAAPAGAAPLRKLCAVRP